MKAKGINLEEEPNYAILDTLQSPALKRLDVTWRNVSGDSREDQHLRDDSKDLGMTTFCAWIKSFERDNTVIPIDQGGAKPDSSYPPNDPSVVYYHGPLHDGQPGPLIPPGALHDQNLVQKLHDRLVLKHPLSIEECDLIKKTTCQYWQPGKMLHGVL